MNRFADMTTAPDGRRFFYARPKLNTEATKVTKTTKVSMRIRDPVTSIAIDDDAFVSFVTFVAFVFGFGLKIAG